MGRWKRLGQRSQRGEEKGHLQTLSQGVSRGYSRASEVLGGQKCEVWLEQSYHICKIWSETPLVAEASPKPAIILSSNLASLSGHQGQIRGEGSFMELNHLTKQSYGNVQVSKSKGTMRLRNSTQYTVNKTSTLLSNSSLGYFPLPSLAFLQGGV